MRRDSFDENFLYPDENADDIRNLRTKLSHLTFFLAYIFPQKILLVLS